MKEHTVAFDGYHLRVHEVGEGPAVVFGHSLTFDSSMWAAQVEALSHRYRLLLIDLHGHGGSTAPPRVFTLEEMADDVVAAVLRGYHPVVHCGGRRGAATATAVASPGVVDGAALRLAPLRAQAHVRLPCRDAAARAGPRAQPRRGSGGQPKPRERRA